MSDSVATTSDDGPSLQWAARTRIQSLLLASFRNPRLVRLGVPAWSAGA
ncbi:hypothetical protein [Halorussus aquaticus]|uniref:Uncharacterized protein n=1 Tax=Halorussus aquaticus TaxID=2953748 RepID=A0ABD5PYA9_9EURY|nr:hypothetical protein [Halorussus aquaticus]